MGAIKTYLSPGTLILIFGLIISSYGFSFLVNTGGLNGKGIIVKGKIVNISEKGDYHAPIINFKSKEDRTYTFLSKMELKADSYKYKIDQEVDVVYNKDNPKIAKIYGLEQRSTSTLYPYIFGLPGLLLVGAGIFLIRKAKQKAAQV